MSIPGLNISHVVVCDQTKEHRLKIVSYHRENLGVLHINPFISFYWLTYVWTLKKYEAQALHVHKNQLKYTGVTNNSKSCEKKPRNFHHCISN